MPDSEPYFLAEPEPFCFVAEPVLVGEPCFVLDPALVAEPSLVVDPSLVPDPSEAALTAANSSSDLARFLKSPWKNFVIFPVESIT